MNQKDIIYYNNHAFNIFAKKKYYLCVLDFRLTFFLI